MIRLVVSNQRGGVAKTTTAITIASLFAEQGKRVLLIDTDPQGSIHSILGMKPRHDFYDALISELIFEDCIVEARRNLWVLPSNRRTAEAEHMIAARTGRELTFINYFGPLEDGYDVIVIDVAPSITLLQTCAMMYARRVLVPVAMEPLSLQGAGASLFAANSLNGVYRLSEKIQLVGFLPVMVNQRLAITKTITLALQDASEKHRVPILPSIRTDQAVLRAAKDKTFLIDTETSSKALEDYRTALEAILQNLSRIGEVNYASENSAQVVG